MVCFKCDNPLITMAIARETVGGLPRGCKSCGECNPALYNGGSWRSYEELCRYVREVIIALEKNGLRFKQQSGNLFVLGRKDVPAHVFQQQTLILPPVVPSKGPVGVNLSSPFLSEHGGGFISEHGAGLVGKSGAGVLTDWGVGFISDQGAGIAPKGGAALIGGSRGLLSVGAQHTIPVGRGKLALS